MQISPQVELHESNYLFDGTSNGRIQSRNLVCVGHYRTQDLKNQKSVSSQFIFVEIILIPFFLLLDLPSVQGFAVK